jgi:GNAT superfamily N-acetyltransferase
MLTSDRILLNPTDADLGIAIEDNLHALFRAMSSLPGAELVQTPELGRHCAPPHNPMFKGAWATRLAPEQVDEAFDDVLAWFAKRRAPFFFWWTGPSTRPLGLGERLAERGLISMEAQTEHLAGGLKVDAQGAPGMAADLDAVDEGRLREVPRGFTIERVRDERALRDFRQAVAEAYALPDVTVQAWVDATLTFGFERAPWRLYLGRLDGEPVATTLLFNGGGVAGVYAVGTVERARGKGIGGAITLAPLLEAREEGYRHAVLFSTAIGVRAYERIGFRLIDAWIDRYLWRAA